MGLQKSGIGASAANNPSTAQGKQPKNRAEGDPAAQQLTDVSLEKFVGEEAPVARAGPRSPDAFYRGEEAGAALKTFS